MNLRGHTHALVRPPGESFARAISSRRAQIDPALARSQHAEYCQALSDCGVQVELLPPDERYPDSCFMQDPAMVVGGRAIVNRLSPPSRSGEEEGAAAALAARIPLAPPARVQPPGTLEGGDVMILSDGVLAGLSARSNRAGIDQLSEILSPLGIPVVAVPIAGYLHLLSAAMYLGGNMLLALPGYAANPAFQGLDTLIVPPEEAYAVNVLALGDKAIVPAGFPRVAGMLEACGFQVLPVPVSEFAAADGGVTCLSLVY